MRKWPRQMLCLRRRRRSGAEPDQERGHSNIGRPGRVRERGPTKAGIATNANYITFAESVNGRGGKEIIANVL